MNIYSKLIEIPGKLLCNQCRFPGPFMLAVRKLKDSGHSGAVTKEGFSGLLVLIGYPFPEAISPVSYPLIV
jgi:hypothetical protein